MNIQRLYNIFIILVIVFSSFALTGTHTALAASTDSLVCDWNKISSIDWQEEDHQTVKCKLQSPVMTPLPAIQQEANASESSTDIPTVPW